MIIKLHSATIVGIQAHLVTVEVSLKASKTHSFSIVGMGDKAVQESRKRIFAALDGFGVDLSHTRVTVNLAPAELKKGGSSFDLPIAAAILHVFKMVELPSNFLKETLFIGELSFDGTIRGVRGIMNMVLDAKDLGMKNILLPYENYTQEAKVDGVTIAGIKSLMDFRSFIKDPDWVQEKPEICDTTIINDCLDFGAIKGQKTAKRMLQIGVAGNHNCIIVGPPGSGKTMMAQATNGLMPKISFKESIETTRVYAATPHASSNIIKTRPFRAPHHGVSQAGMVGGGTPLMPGEISLAHNGILFLDELTEFRRGVIEALRQPLEDKIVTISRAHSTITFPCAFMLIAALNPCPCGNLGDMKRGCTCSKTAIYNYLSKISGPFLDRIDLQIFIQSANIDEISQKESGWDTKSLKEGIKKARAVQFKRFKSDGKYNGQMNPQEIEEFCQLTKDAKKLIDFCFDKFQMSMRGYHKIIKVSRTIADMSGDDKIQESHVKEALMYRGIEQKLTLLSKS